MLLDGGLGLGRVLAEFSIPLFFPGGGSRVVLSQVSWKWFDDLPSGGRKWSRGRRRAYAPGSRRVLFGIYRMGRRRLWRPGAFYGGGSERPVGGLRLVSIMAGKRGTVPPVEGLAG